MNKIREKVYFEISRTKKAEFFCEKVALRFQKIDLFMSIFLTGLASGSALAIIVAKKFPVLWAVVVLVSQILAVVRQYLVFPRYVSDYKEKSNKLAQLSISQEELFHSINNNNISKTEAINKSLNYLENFVKTNRFSKDIIRFQHKKLIVKAENDAKDHMNNYVLKS